jgi:hypothetical protein
MSNITEVSIMTATECFSYMSPPIIQKDYQYYNTFKVMYVLSGNCTLNNREQAVRKFIIDPTILENVE